MSMLKNPEQSAYGLSSPLVGIFPQPIKARRNPANTDRAEIGQSWVNMVNGTSYICTRVVANVTTWSVTAVTDPGAVNIGGLLTCAVGVTVTTGDIEATLGDIVAVNGDFSLDGAATAYYLPDGMRITSGAGAPANGLALVVGDIYIRTNPAGAASRIYIATAVGTWTNVTCAA